MESTNLFEAFLWILVALIGSGMITVLFIGWMKGAQWQREMKAKRKHIHN